MTARQRDTALGSGAVAMLFNEWIEARFDLPEPNVPDLGRDANAESAAAAYVRRGGLASYQSRTWFIFWNRRACGSTR